MVGGHVPRVRQNLVLQLHFSIFPGQGALLESSWLTPVRVAVVRDSPDRGALNRLWRRRAMSK